jgi:hypothetical protein
MTSLSPQSIYENVAQTAHRMDLLIGARNPGIPLAKARSDSRRGIKVGTFEPFQAAASKNLEDANGDPPI